MDFTSRTLTGAIATLLSLWIGYFALTDEAILFIYALPMFGIGVYMLFIKGEDTIEPIKERRDSQDKE